MWTSIGIVAGVVTAGLVAKRAWGAWRRSRGRARLVGVPLLREARGVPAYALVAGVGEAVGLRAGRRNRAVADLLLGTDRFVLATSRGVWLDLRLGEAGALRSVRCTGPGRLLFEGELRGLGDDPGLFRFELVIEDAAAWAKALSPFARPAAG